MWTYIWLAVLAVSLIVEFVTLELVSVWVSVGAIIAMILAMCGVMLEIQLAVFVVVTIACILGLRKVTLRLLNKNKGKTNIDVIINTTHKLIKPILEDEPGAIKINGIEWSVKFENDETAEVGEHVEILAVDGNKFIVKKVDNTIKEQTANNTNNVSLEEKHTKQNKTKVKEMPETKQKSNKVQEEVSGKQEKNTSAKQGSSKQTNKTTANKATKK